MNNFYEIDLKAKGRKYHMKDINVILLDKKLALEEAKNERLRANQDYIAMMTDVEIPEEEDYEQEV